MCRVTRSLANMDNPANILMFLVASAGFALGPLGFTWFSLAWLVCFFFAFLGDLEVPKTCLTTEDGSARSGQAKKENQGVASKSYRSMFFLEKTKGKPNEWVEN